MSDRDGGLRKEFRKHLPRVHWESIETGLTNRGVPDMNGCYNGAEFWVENKQASGYAVRVRPEQVAWALRRVRAGGRTFFAVRRRAAAGPRRGGAVDELWLVAGADAAALRAGGLLAVAPLGRWSGGPRAWDWPEVLVLLSGRPTPRPLNP